MSTSKTGVMLAKVILGVKHYLRISPESGRAKWTVSKDRASKFADSDAAQTIAQFHDVDIGKAFCVLP